MSLSPSDLTETLRGFYAGKWRAARNRALAILHAAELRRKHLAEAEAAFYADAEDGPCER